VTSHLKPLPVGIGKRTALLKLKVEINMQLNRRQFGGLSLGAVVLAVSSKAFAAAALKELKPAGSGKADHSAFDVILQQYVSVDAAGYASLNYSALTGQRGAVDNYVSGLIAVDPRQLSRAEAHAYWINLYNAKTLSIMLENWPVKSIRDINLGGGGFFGKGPWSKKLMVVAETELSLDDIEHRIIRPLFNDPLSHYALNCASYSCPNLMPRAYTAKNLKAQMSESATLYINHPRGLSIKDGEITASKIFYWYAGDFGGKNKLKAHWMEFAAPQLAAEIEASSIGGYDYDWNANVAR
jgi:Protein of unknown function, DUF547